MPGSGRLACLRQAQQGTIYSVLVRAAPGPAGAAALARYVSRTARTLVIRRGPAELVNFGEAVNFPLLFGGLLALFGAATMVHLLLVSVGRRRTEAGLLKVLGFVRRQVAAVVSWQATAVALVGIVAGLPLGIAAGKVAWQGVRHELRRGAGIGGAGRAAGRAGRLACWSPRTYSP